MTSRQANLFARIRRTHPGEAKSLLHILGNAGGGPWCPVASFVPRPIADQPGQRIMYVNPPAGQNVQLLCLASFPRLFSRMRGAPPAAFRRGRGGIFRISPCKRALLWRVCFPPRSWPFLCCSKPTFAIMRVNPFNSRLPTRWASAVSSWWRRFAFSEGDIGIPRGPAVPSYETVSATSPPPWHLKLSWMPACIPRRANLTNVAPKHSKMCVETPLSS